MRCLFMVTSAAAMTGATMAGTSPEGVAVVGAGAGTGASAADMSAL